MGSRRRFGNTSNPLVVIEWILAVQTIVGGAYLLSPFLHIPNLIHSQSPLIAIIASHAAVWGFAIVVIFFGLLTVAGIVRRKVGWRSAGLFGMGLVRLYALLATLLAHGILPLSWLSSAVCMVIVFYIWARIRKRGRE